ncbi:hypothetical protein GCM10017621_31680 [Maricaulis virginensis]|uniref:Uncharacterized protein n=1 Tax=Maricaulis virginensis TaxID=144022 RepID=A0A9W6IQU0_9PROT|nr:hypothetical protein GCM10017621_31680 [Maricaulis virginensis]
MGLHGRPSLTEGALPKEPVRAISSPPAHSRRLSLASNLPQFPKDNATGRAGKRVDPTPLSPDPVPGPGIRRHLCSVCQQSQGRNALCASGETGPRMGRGRYPFNAAS